ncbi:MAG: IclR family transcriptional regulator [Proteobacteria bacterium]|nr:IclR family transcriptional regulator [Pseudomonadota bacterium]MBU1581879.1 IclR family transcriptional regulator [Pseudomonadota bacterium]MBU2629021.1 IclR family transcriptional regulator [Pseudomonadota bacterium]
MDIDNKKPNSIEKALDILLKFQEVKPSWGIRELSTELCFSPATVQRILQVFKSYEFVRQDPNTRQYFIGNVFYRFLENLNGSNNLTRIGRRFMEEVAADTLETVHLNIIEGDLRICIDTIESPKVLKAGMPIGNQSPLYAGASAKCLLAFSSKKFQDNYFKTTKIKPVTENTITLPGKLFEELHKIKEQGYALSLGERTPGLGSLSAPVFDYKGQILASLSLAIPEIRLKQKDHLSNCINILTSAANSFSKEMGLAAEKF